MDATKKDRRCHQKQKAKLDSLSDELDRGGWKSKLTQETFENILAAGFRGKNLALAAVTAEIALYEHPLTLRGLFYRVVSAGWLPSTDKENYDRIGRVLGTLRECGIIPFEWIVDNLRSTIKPPSWSGLADFTDTVREAYRKDYWSQLPEYVHIFCEKDAIAGVIQPVTREYDVPLSPVRGYASLSFAHEIGEQFAAIDKPISAYYLGDFDASGFDIERDLYDKISRYSRKVFGWIRLGVNEEDFEEFELLPLAVKTSDRRSSTFVKEHGDQCAELDALPATEIRRRVESAIKSHIPDDTWQRLRTVEEAERESFNKVLSQFQGGAP